MTEKTFSDGFGGKMTLEELKEAHNSESWNPDIAMALQSAELWIAGERIAELEAENKVLWDFVNAADEWHDINNPVKTNVRVLQTREALQPYEKKPFTYDPDAPLKLA